MGEACKDYGKSQFKQEGVITEAHKGLRKKARTILAHSGIVDFSKNKEFWNYSTPFSGLNELVVVDISIASIKLFYLEHEIQTIILVYWARIIYNI
ncbi:MAG: hypothetical protein ACYS6K_02455 [Planctomycetota bacterium]|jgi:hypothetical protein